MRNLSLVAFDRVGASASHVEPDRAKYEGLLAGLAALGLAGALLDRNWRVLAINDAGEAFVAKELDTRNGRLAGKTRDVNLRLHRLDRSLACELSAIAVIPSLPHALILRAGRLQSPVGCAEIVLTFNTLGGTCFVGETALRDGFGLTTTEARIAVAIAEGNNLRRIAESRSVSIDTVRSHLRTIFAKTKTRRQAELVLLTATLYR